jgi:radical SAM protein with 4Fe4S-binding SPASM domain
MDFTFEKPSISIQWHITTECGNRCRHCYVFDEATYARERAETLPLEGLKQVLGRIEEFERKWDVSIENFTISGGDPLLREDWDEFLSILKAHGKSFRILGNPETLTEETAARLKELGVDIFQMSLDGLETKHDEFRSPGSFRRTLDALDLLKRHGIRSNIMFTLYPSNADQLIPLATFMATETPAVSFSFDIGSCVGNAREIGDSCLTRKQLHRLLSDYIDEKHRLRALGYPIAMREKPNLLKLAQFEKGMLHPVGMRSAPIISGCLAGWISLSILADGTVLACRRLPLPVGKLPEQSFEEIFLGNELLRKLRRPEFFAVCGTCDFYQSCRGCPANSYGVTGDPFSVHPSCFRGDIPRRTDEASLIRSGPPMDATMEEEFAWFASKFRKVDSGKVREFLYLEELQALFVDLCLDPAEKAAFLLEPRAWLRKRGVALDDEQIFFLMNYFSGEPLGPLAEKVECFICESMLKFEREVIAGYLGGLGAAP